MDDTMVHMLPIIYQRLLQLAADPSEASSLLQKQILKIFYAYVQVNMYNFCLCSFYFCVGILVITLTMLFP